MSGAFRRLFILGAAFVALVSAAPASAAEFSASATLSGPTASVGSPVLAAADFGLRFVAVDDVCLHFTFAGDLLDPGDAVIVSALNGQPSLSGAGFGAATTQTTRTLCINNGPGQGPLASLFLDGREDRIEVAMASGSVTIADLTVSVHGVALVPLPAQTVTLTFRSESGRTVTWSGAVVAGGLDVMHRADGVLESLGGSSQLAGGTSLSADFETRNVGRLIQGSLTATKGNQRMAARNMIGVATADGIELNSRATYFDGRSTLFGDLSIRIT